MLGKSTSIQYSIATPCDDPAIRQHMCCCKRKHSQTRTGNPQVQGRGGEDAAWECWCTELFFLVLLDLVTHAQKECTHQLALPWGTRHLISPELAGKDVMILLLLLVHHLPC